MARANGPRDRRFRIEHAQHLRPADITRIAKTNVIASMQPYHVIDDGRWAAKRIDSTGCHDTYAFRDLIDQGAHLGFGSDWTVAPLDPILGIYAAVTRRTLDGKNPGGWFPAQKITVDEALRAYTAENAYGVFAEGRRGVLKPGARADLVLLDRDLTPDSADRHPEHPRAGDRRRWSRGVPGAMRARLAGAVALLAGAFFGPPLAAQSGPVAAVSCGFGVCPDQGHDAGGGPGRRCRPAGPPA